LQKTFRLELNEDYLFFEEMLDREVMLGRILQWFEDNTEVTLEDASEQARAWHLHPGMRTWTMKSIPNRIDFLATLIGQGKLVPSRNMLKWLEFRELLRIVEAG